MIELERTRRKIDFKKYKNRHAEETDFDEIIDEPFTLRENGKLIVALVEPSQNLEALRQACKTIKYTKSYRSNGLLTTSRCSVMNRAKLCVKTTATSLQSAATTQTKAKYC